MLALVKDCLLALVLEILISMTRTLLEGQLKLLEELLEKDPRQSTRNLAIQLNCLFNKVLNRLRALVKENLKKSDITYCTT